MKSYEETRKAIRKALDEYTNNTHAVAQMMIDVVTHDITCNQFDKFFEKLIDRVLCYHNRKTYEDIIINISSLTDRPFSIRPNSDNEDAYKTNLNTIGQAVSDAADNKLGGGYGHTEKEYTQFIADLASTIYDGISSMAAIDLAKELLALNDDTLDSDDISEIISTMDYNQDYVNTMSIAIREFISDTSQADMKDNLGYITHIVSSCTNIENYSLFYALVQKELMYRLNKEGENTDVF